MNGKVKLLTSGFLTSIQDEGRFGCVKYGVPRSGAMDQKSYRFANLLLGNDENDACLEWVFQAPVLQFLSDTVIVLAGAEVEAFLNDKKVEMYTPIQVCENDILRIGRCRNKVYGYVGIKNRFLTSVVLNSRSFYNSVTEVDLLKSKDEIECKMNANFTKKYSSFSRPILEVNDVVLEVYIGPEFDLLSKEQQVQIRDASFTISNTFNRMAIRLKEKMVNSILSILSAPVLPGTIQLTPAGDLMVLMRDCQTTGGYPRILQLSEDAIDIIAQLRMGKQFRFELVEL